MIRAKGHTRIHPAAPYGSNDRKARLEDNMMNRAGRQVRTSESHPIQVDWLPRAVADRVGLTFAPGKKCASRDGSSWDRDLSVDLDLLAHKHKATTLVCLMETPELTSNGIPDLIVEAKRRGITTIHFPIRDVDAPSSVESVDRLLVSIEERLASDERIVIHCLGGLGRTGTIATCLLVRRGMPLEEAIELVKETRCKDFPQGGRQGPFVAEYEVHIRQLQAQPPATNVAPREPSRRSASVPTSDTVTPWNDLVAAAGALRTAEGGRSQRQVGDLLAEIESQVMAGPAKCFALTADGTATLSVKGRSYHAGRFETPTIGELKTRLRAAPPATRGSIRISILRGSEPQSDIGTLQACAPPGTLFQAASQFNCLEAPGPHIVAVRQYLTDPTQGPRASVSAFPGTFLRHYFAGRQDGVRFVQSDRDCINLLADAIEPGSATVKSGYLTTETITDSGALANSLEERFELIRVGLHDDVEVVFGNNWGGPVPNAPHQRIAQTFTSTIALGGYSRTSSSPALATVAQQLLRAAYLGTLLGALALGKQNVVLTLIGGGVFGNPHRAIWDAIHWAAAEAEAFANGTLDVLVNARTETIEASDMTRVRERGGFDIELSRATTRTPR